MNAPQTLPELFFNAIEKFGTKEAALRYKEDGTWKGITHQELAKRVKHVALGLKELGLRHGDHIAILSGNRPEWAVADYGCLTARLADVPVYPTLPASQVQYILDDSESRGVFVENYQQYEKVAAVRDTLPKLEFVIAFEASEGMEGPGVISFRELMQRGAAAEDKYPNYREDALATQPTDLATLIYTSGTTGPPKGVMLTHRNFCTNVIDALKVLHIGPEDTCLSAAPLSHSFERMAGHYTMLHAGTTIAYAESVEKIPDGLQEVNPTIMIFVPRLYEKVYARVLENAMSGGALKRRIFFWARARAEAWADLTLAKQPVPKGLAMQKAIADKLVFAKLRARTGGRIRFFVSGAAPLNAEIAKFFFAAGIPIVEGYGLTETAPVIAANPLESIRIGTVGPPIPNVEVKIAEDGEILAKGPNVMQGYYRKPEATAEAIDAHGWFHTGDIGEIDEKGYLKITDRKKDLIVTAGGKKVAPQPIEGMLKTNKFVLNAVMVGNKRKYPSLLIVPDFDALKPWAKERNISFTDNASLLAQPDVVAKVEREVMGSLRDLASFEMPKKITLLEDDFTIDAGELTPTMKVKRSVVEEKYADRIEAMYQD